MRQEPWTIRRLLGWMRDDFAKLGVAAPRLDAELLIAHVLGCQRVQLYLDLDRPLQTQELSAIRAAVKRRRTHEPIAYILGVREFYGRSFAVDRRVLIPRPDTELLVDEALQSLASAVTGVRVLDLCTGSGCVGLTIAAERPRCLVDVADCSVAALAVAGANAVSLRVQERVEFLPGDLWAAVPPGRQYPLIVCNPPYVSEAQWPTLDEEVRLHEPRMALVAEDGGYAFYRALLARAVDFLDHDGRLLMEVGLGQAEGVQALCHDAGLTQTRLHRDLGGVLRVVSAVRA